MKLGMSLTDEAFREEVRAFVAAELDPVVKYKVENGLWLGRDDYVGWYRTLERRGWLLGGWPVDHGGPGWSPLRRMIFDDEILLGGAPRFAHSGITMLGPVLMEYGSTELKAEHLGPIRRSEVWWAQGFSEPQAGSDLASLRTTAVRDGEDFIVNGHKTWTSFGQFSDKMFALVRTDAEAKPQAGISFILFDLDTPGVAVRPIEGLDHGDDLNEIFLDDVRVPARNLVGELNRGWTYTKFLLGKERTGIAGIASSKQQLARVRRLAGTRVRRGKQLADDPIFQVAVANLEIDLIALEHTVMRMLTAPAESTGDAEASLLKLRGTEIRQAIHRLLLDVAGPAASVFIPEALADPAYVPAIDQQGAAAANYLDSRKLSIYGGANEIQRNILASAVLRL